MSDIVEAQKKINKKINKCLLIEGKNDSCDYTYYLLMNFESKQCMQYLDKRWKDDIWYFNFPSSKWETLTSLLDDSCKVSIKQSGYIKKINVLEYAGKGFNALSLKYLAVINDDGNLLAQTILHEEEVDQICLEYYRTKQKLTQL